MTKVKDKKSRFILLKFFLPLAILLAFAIFSIWYLHTHNVQVLNPQGSVARQEKSLMAFTVMLGSLVVIPVFILTVFIAWRYREKGKAKYSPDYDHNRVIEFIWWAIPITLITILAVVTWISTYKLDPYISLAASDNSLDIQVVSLDWKWLFIYPKQNIATVNFIDFPVNTPVHFDITSDTVMDSFWIPQLSGQIYSMPGMTTQLNIQAGSPGDFNGSSANISGQGFAGMTFVARASTESDFQNWVDYARKSNTILSQSVYDKLAKPSSNNPVVYYSSVDSDLFNSILSKYMMPSMPTKSSPSMPSGSSSSNMNMNMAGM